MSIEIDISELTPEETRDLLKACAKILAVEILVEALEDALTPMLREELAARWSK